MPTLQPAMYDVILFGATVYHEWPSHSIEIGELMSMAKKIGWLKGAVDRLQSKELPPEKKL